MKKILSLLLAMTLAAPLCLLGASCDGNGSNAEAGGSFGPEIEQAIVDAVESNLELYGGDTPVPGAVIGVWSPGEGTFVRGMGKSDLSAGMDMSTVDKFRVGSNTKTFVVTVILQLVDEGRLSLDDTVSGFDLGVEVPAGDEITVRMLCNMTSGLFEVYHAPQLADTEVNPLTVYEPAELVEIAVRNPSLYPPGQGWNYSNTNYLLLGMIIEKVTGNEVADEITGRLIIPLDLRNTSYPKVYPGMPCPYAHGYSAGDDGEWADVSVFFSPTLTGAAGAMISDMDDMKKWVKAYVTGATNSEATQKERLAAVETGRPGMEFGLGIGTSGGWWGYTGGLEGYNTAAYYLPEKDAYIIAFVTTQSNDPPPGVANAIVRDIAKVVFPDNVPFTGEGGL